MLADVFCRLVIEQGVLQPTLYWIHLCYGWGTGQGIAEAFFPGNKALQIQCVHCHMWLPWCTALHCNALQCTAHEQLFSAEQPVGQGVPCRAVLCCCSWWLECCALRAARRLLAPHWQDTPFCIQGTDNMPCFSNHKPFKACCVPSVSAAEMPQAWQAVAQIVCLQEARVTYACWAATDSVAHPHMLHHTSLLKGACFISVVSLLWPWCCIWVLIAVRAMITTQHFVTQHHKPNTWSWLLFK